MNKEAQQIAKGEKAKTLVESGQWDIVKEHIESAQRLLSKAMQNGVEKQEHYWEYVGKYKAYEAMKELPNILIKKGEKAQEKYDNENV